MCQTIGPKEFFFDKMYQFRIQFDCFIALTFSISAELDFPLSRRLEPETSMIRFILSKRKLTNLRRSLTNVALVCKFARFTSDKDAENDVCYDLKTIGFSKSRFLNLFRNKNMDNQISSMRRLDCKVFRLKNKSIPPPSVKE